MLDVNVNEIQHTQAKQVRELRKKVWQRRGKRENGGKEGERERDQERQAILQIKSINRLGISAIEN